VNSLLADVAVIGGGPAGLTAAAALAANGGAKVLVLEREAAAGGIPRHSAHLGYGIRDVKRFSSGPSYAHRLVDRAGSAGVDIRTGTMVTGWSDGLALEVTSPQGRQRVEARAVILATGARERPRSARLIPGDRCTGVYTTGQLQNLVHLQHRQVGRRAVVVGAELVSYSAVLTLKHIGCDTAVMTTTHPSPESYALFNVIARSPLLGVEVATRIRVARIIGKPALRAVELEHVDTGARRIVECDTLVLTGDWVPDHELARTAGLDMDPGTLGPVVDAALRTSRSGVFAAGNLLHAVDTADVAALDGRHVADSVRAYLRGESTPDDGVRVYAEAPLRWISPGILRPGDVAPARNRMLSWTDALIRVPRVVVRQDGRVVNRRTVPWPASPGRVFRIPAGLLDGIDPWGGPVTVGLA
jgi:thioredoxin reductase